MKLSNTFFTLVLLTLFSFSLTSAQTPIALYKFDGNLNDAMGSFNAVDSAGPGSAQYAEGYDGTPNGAINFPATDDGWYRVDCGRFSPSQEGTVGEFTISFWANWNGNPGHKYEDVIDKRDEWNDTGMVWSIGQHGRWDGKKLGLWRGGSGDREYGSSDSIREGVWNYWTITFDANNSIATFYKDGVQYDQGIYAPGTGYDAMVYMGCSNSGGVGDSYNGKLDEVAFYSKILTDQEIKTLYESYTSSSTVQPIALYKFDGNLNDAMGSFNAVDSAGPGSAQYAEGYDGTPNGAINFPATDDGWYRVDCGRFSPSQEGTVGEFTISFWANWNGNPGHKYEDVIDKRDEWNDTGMVWSIGQHGRWDGKKLGLWRGGSGDREYGSSDSIREGVWNYWTITFDANNSIATFYKDGVQYDQGIYAPGTGYDAMVYMGCSNSGGVGDSYNGKLDEVAFYSKILTDQEITDLFNSFVTDVELVSNSIPSDFELTQNYPNPFNPSTKIDFSIPKTGNYSLRVYNLLGQEVATLIDGQMNAGIHIATFDASNLSSGIYFYTLTGNNVNLTKKMILMK